LLANKQSGRDGQWNRTQEALKGKVTQVNTGIDEREDWQDDQVDRRLQVGLDFLEQVTVLRCLAVRDEQRQDHAGEGGMDA